MEKRDQSSSVVLKANGVKGGGKKSKFKSAEQFFRVKCKKKNKIGKS